MQLLLKKAHFHLSLELSILKTGESVVAIQNLPGNNILSGNYSLFFGIITMCFTFCRCGI